MYIHLKMSLLKKYRSLPVQAKASIWFLICAFLQKGISVLTTPIFTRLLTAAEYGQFNVFNSWLSILQIFISLNLSFGVYAQGLVKFSEDRYVFSSSMQGLSSILSVFWTIIYILFHNQWNELFGLNTLQMLSMLILIWTTQIFNFWAAEQRVLYKYKKLVILTLIVSIAKPVLGILFIEVATDKVTARIISLMLVEVVCFLGLFISQMRRGHTFFNKAYWKYALLFNIPLVPHYLSTVGTMSAEHAFADGETRIHLPGGSLTLSQLTAMLNTIPLEITFVDIDNVNRYFNEGPKVFKRPGMALCREVFTCHPPKIEERVRRIIGEFRAGNLDQVPVWMDKGGRTFLVTYYAVRDKQEQYLGTLELVQDMEFAKEHFR